MVQSGGGKCVCPFEITPKERCAIKSKRWTLLDLIAFDVTPIICIFIFAEIRITPLYKTGMGFFAEVEGNAYEDDFFDKKSGPGKLYPSNPTYLYKVREVTCMC